MGKEKSIEKTADISIETKSSGINNRNIIDIHINLEDGNCTLKEGDREICDIAELWKKTINVFHLQDEEINEKLQKRVLDSKTGEPIDFDSSKMISSLTKIGIPIPVAVEIVYKAISSINRMISDESSEVKTLSTKEIRKEVVSIIRNLDVAKWPYVDIKKWAERYVRKYGHNNRIIQIVDIPLKISKEPVRDISYDFILNYFLPDLISDIAPAVQTASEITTSQKRDMADEVINFINSCDLYSIKYSILKSMIAEIATQLPHPWFVDKQSRRQLIERDRKSVIGNIEIAKDELDKSEAISTYTATELLHHSSSMILEKYFRFLGCGDLTAFYKLSDVIHKAANINPEEWDIAVSDSAFRNFFDDCLVANIDFDDYLKTIKGIMDCYDSGAIGSKHFGKLVCKFSDTSLSIQQYGDGRKIKDFLNTPWNWELSGEICENVKTVLRMIYPPTKRKRNPLSPQTDNFWISYQGCLSEAHTEMKRSVFTIISKNDDFDFSRLEPLNDIKCSTICNTVLLVAERFEDRQIVESNFRNYIRKFQYTDYVPLTLSKEDLKSIFESNNHREAFERIIDEQLLPSD